MPGPKANGDFPEGDADPTFAVIKTWKAEVRAYVKSSGVTMSEIARRIGTSPSMVSQILKPDGGGSRRNGRAPVRHSRFVVAIAKVTGIPLPTLDASDLMSQGAEFLRIIERQNPAYFAKLVEFLRQTASLSVADSPISRDDLGDSIDTGAHAREGEGVGARSVERRVGPPSKR